MDQTPFKHLAKLASQYGMRALENYTLTRSLAERLRDRFNLYLKGPGQSVFLVPPKGPFGPGNARSGAFSVSGQGILPLEPISFGLALRLAKTGGLLRLVVSCMKEGSVMRLKLEGGKTYDLALSTDEKKPASDEELDKVCHFMHDHATQWFSTRIQEYDNGEYGSQNIGFDIISFEEMEDADDQGEEVKKKT